MTDGELKINSDTAWNIASDQWSWTLASTRTLAAQIDVALSEARSTGRREAYELRMKRFRSGCACHINDSDEIVSMCKLHEGLVYEARATGRREGMAAMIGALNDDALTKRAADFLLERDQQTTQDERDEGEREASAFVILQMGAAAIRAAMEKGK